MKGYAFLLGDNMRKLLLFITLCYIALPAKSQLAIYSEKNNTDVFVYTNKAVIQCQHIGSMGKSLPKEQQKDKEIIITYGFLNKSLLVNMLSVEVKDVATGKIDAKYPFKHYVAEIAVCDLSNNADKYKQYEFIEIQNPKDEMHTILSYISTESAPGKSSHYLRLGKTTLKEILSMDSELYSIMFCSFYNTKGDNPNKPLVQWYIPKDDPYNNKNLLFTYMNKLFENIGGISPYKVNKK